MLAAPWRSQPNQRGIKMDENVFVLVAILITAFILGFAMAKRQDYYTIVEYKVDRELLLHRLHDLLTMSVQAAYYCRHGEEGFKKMYPYYSIRTFLKDLDKTNNSNYDYLKEQDHLHGQEEGRAAFD